MNIFHKIKNIIIGNWRNATGYQSDTTKLRRQICKRCSHNVKFAGTRICDLCGCIIDSKTTVESEKCLMNKW